jgi:DNA-binding transcriptional MerR regulator
MTVQDISEEVGLPPHVVRSFLARHNMLSAPQYPRQHRSFDARQLPKLKRMLAAAGYPVQELAGR